MSHIYKFFLTLCLSLMFCCGHLLAGTPPVAKLQCDDHIMAFAVGSGTPPHVIAALTEDDKPVIPTKWDITPDLPEGLRLERGIGADKYMLYISGTPQQQVSFTRYTITAENNGNIAKKIPAAKITIDIIIKPLQKICFMTEEGVKVMDLTDFHTTFVPLGGRRTSSLIPSSYADGAFVVVHRDSNSQYLHFIDPVQCEVTESINVGMDIEFTKMFQNGKKLILVGPHEPDFEKMYAVVVDLTSRKIVQKKLLHDFKNLVRIDDFLLVNGYLVYCRRGAFLGEENVVIFDIETLEMVRSLSLEFSSHAASDEILALYHRQSNSLMFVDPKKDTVDRWGIQNFTHPSSYTPFLYGDGFFIGVGQSVFGDYYILRLKPDEQLLPIPFGRDIPKAIAYGNGMIGVISEKEFKIFSAQNREEIFSKKKPAVIDIMFANDHFFVSDATGETYSYDTRKLPWENSLKTLDLSFVRATATKVENDVFCMVNTTFGSNEVFVMDGDRLTVRKQLLGKCAAMTSDKIAVGNGNILEIYDVATLKREEQIFLPNVVIDISCNGNSWAVICKDTNQVVLVDTKNYATTNFTLDHQSPIHLQYHADRLIVLSRKNVESFDIVVDVFDTNQYKRQFSLAPDGFEIDTILQFGNGKICLSSPRGGNQRLLVYDILENRQVLTHAAEFGIRSAFVGKNHFAFFDRSQATVTVVDLRSPETNIIELGIPFARDMACGDRSLVITSSSFDEIFIVDTMTWQFRSALNFESPIELFFLRNKFFIRYDNESYYLLLDGIFNQKLGTINPPWQQDFKVVSYYK